MTTAKEAMHQMAQIICDRYGEQYECIKKRSKSLARLDDPVTVYVATKSGNKWCACMYFRHDSLYIIEWRSKNAQCLETTYSDPELFAKISEFLEQWVK